MTGPKLAVLTPPGAGAIAVVAVAGAGAFDLAAPLLRRPAGKTVPASAMPSAFWFGTLGDGVGDEVVLSLVRTGPEPWVEVHCHGGRRVVRWVVDLLVGRGAVEVPPSELPHRGGPDTDARALGLLTRATTTRAAAVLLDQYHGAFRRACDGLAHAWDDAAFGRLIALGPVGRHLVTPWSVVVAGPPNVGKSSLVNALAGYHRSVVAPAAGTTRDVVTTAVAFAGWPVELADTAGLRATAEELEALGIERARAVLAGADAVIWVLDATDPDPVWPTAADALPAGRVIVVANKTDRPPAWPVPDGVRGVSAVAGDGIAGLAAAVAHLLVPDPPRPGEAVPFTPALVDALTNVTDATGIATLTGRTDTPTIA